MSTAAKLNSQVVAPTIAPPPVAVVEEPPIRSIVLAQCDDWTALYIDGKKAIENHRLTESDVLFALGIDLQELWIEDEWLENNGHSFPNDLKDFDT